MLSSWSEGNTRFTEVFRVFLTNRPIRPIYTSWTSSEANLIVICRVKIILYSLLRALLQSAHPQSDPLFYWRLDDDSLLPASREPTINSNKYQHRRIEQVFPLALSPFHIFNIYLINRSTMAKSSMLLAAAVIAGTASAFAPAASTRASTCLNEEAFCRGYVGGEGPEPIPFAGIQQKSANWDPLDFTGVSNNSNENLN